jgi:predicted transposase YbfD/YdcC
MDDFSSVALTQHFQGLPDPRLQRLCRHEFLDIILIAVCASLCGLTDWTEIQLYGETHADWLKTFLRLPNGIPSHDTFRYVFSRIDPLAFQQCFATWIAALSKACDLKQIAIDGKTLRGSSNRAHNTKGLHLVSAWATENHLSLGQVAVAEKSNEITAIPRLLQLLDIRGALISIDAMGCQKEIASTIREGKADYLLAVKENQLHLYEDIQQTITTHFEQADSTSQATHRETITKGHGRREVRTYTLFTNLEGIRDHALWPDLKGICMATNERTVGDKTTVEVRYYIGSSQGTVAEYAQGIRDHWGIENSLHWVLDVTFGEDGRRQRAEHGAENMAWLRRMVVSLLKNDTSSKGSLKAKSIKALCDNNFLIRLLSQITRSQ